MEGDGKLSIYFDPNSVDVLRINKDSMEEFNEVTAKGLEEHFRWLASGV